MKQKLKDFKESVVSVFRKKKEVAAVKMDFGSLFKKKLKQKVYGDMDFTVY